MPDAQKTEPSLQSVPIGRIDFSPYQIRSAIDDADLRELAASMQQSGLAQPILVRPIADRYELVVGERRTRAAKLLGWESIPAVVKELSDVDAALLLLIEDQQRKDTKPLERARGCQRLMEKFALGQEEIAKRLGVDQSTVSRLLSLLEEPAEIQALLAQDKLSVRHLRALDTIEDPDQRIDVANQAADKSWSVKETERRVNSALKSPSPKKAEGSLAKIDDADLPWPWLRDVVHFLRSMSKLRKVMTAVIHFVARLIPARARKQKSAPRRQIPAEASPEPAAKEAPQPQPDAQPPKAA
jgi:ParB family transcriptional regulator, chromosome partitioning protein